MIGRSHGHYPYRNRRLALFRQLLIVGVIAASALVALGSLWLVSRPPTMALTVPRHYFMAGLFHHTQNTPETPLMLAPLPPAHDDVVLKQKIEALFSQFNPALVPHVYYLNLDNHASVSIRAEQPVAAASVIKLPILYDYFLRVSKGITLRSDEWLLEELTQASGSGGMQFLEPGEIFTIMEVARKMIQESDNTATNMMIHSFGGMQYLNNRFRLMGLTQTRLHNWLPDLSGTNTISMTDMATILYNFLYGKQLCPLCQEDAMVILEGTHNRRLIPAGLPEGSLVAHKTGDIGTSLGNAALVTLPNNQRYILCLQVERPYNHPDAKALMIEISNTIASHLLN